MSGYDYYRNFTDESFYHKFIKRNPEFDNQDFRQWVIGKNRASCDSGELANIAAHEVLRLAHTFAEHRHRASNVYGEGNEGLPESDNNE